MNFTKMQGAGNDFVLLETREGARDWSLIAPAICDRHFGIGADGLLLLLPSETANYKMREFNPDGSEAEACGNGLRCLAKYIFTTKFNKTVPQEILIETKAGIRNCRRCKDMGNITKVQVGMGQPKFGAKEIPLTLERNSKGVVDIKSMLSYCITIEGEQLLLNFISMGNPHAIFFEDKSVNKFPLSKLGSMIEHNAIFPQRTNFEVAQVLNRKCIEVRVWERGVGETLACGSGACAVAVAAQLLGYTDNKVGVKLPGGILDVEWNKPHEVLLGGSAEILFTGEWPEEKLDY